MLQSFVMANSLSAGHEETSVGSGSRFSGATHLPAYDAHAHLTTASRDLNYAGRPQSADATVPNGWHPGCRLPRQGLKLLSLL